MNLHPVTTDELREALSAAHAKREHIDGVNLRSLNRVLEYHPDDMTVTVEAGLTLAGLQAHLAEHGQWLPLDPPDAERLTVGDLLNGNLSGPRRFGYGTVREHLLGLRIALADGRVIKSGGRVVKNVAGYDLLKLLVGSHGTLGVILEATFKVRPLPDREAFVAVACPTFQQAAALLESVLSSELTPIVLDLYNLSTIGAQCSTTLVLGFGGTREEVEWQLTEAGGLCRTELASMDYEARFWGDNSTQPVQRLSVLSSRLVTVLETLGAEAFVARAGNGVVYYRGGAPPPKLQVPANLTRRVKDMFDPNRIFLELPA